MKNKRDEVLKESVSSEYGSSMPRVGDTLAIEAHVEDEEYKIPERYGTNKVVYLPVNTEKSFVYWVVTKEHIENALGYYTDDFCLKLFSGESEVGTYTVKGEEGSSYIAYYAPNSELYVKFGTTKDGKFVELLCSNKITMPSDSISGMQEEQWMSKVSDWIEIISSSIARDGSNSSQELIKIEENLDREKRLKLEIERKKSHRGVSSEEFLGASEQLGGSEMLHGSMDSIKKKGDR